MRSLRAFAILAATLLATSSKAPAQGYPTPSPAPASTSPAVLHDLARERAIAERFHRGLAALDKRAWNDAVLEFQAALALHPHEPQASTAAYDLAFALAQLGRDDEAASALRRALSGDPAFLAAMANLITVDLRRGDLREARAIADRFVALAPDSARALYARGLVALRAGDLATARSDFGTLLRNDPQYAVAHYDLGLTEARLHDDAAALREFDAALALAPQYARARFALGTVLLRTGDRAGARAAFARAQRDAADDVALRALAQSMIDALGSAP